MTSFILKANKEEVADEHKFYMGITQLEWNDKTQKLEIIIQLFSDDYIQVINELYNVKVEVLEANSREMLLEKTKVYLSQNFSIWNNGKKIKTNFIKLKDDVNHVKILLETDKMSDVGSLKIRNSLLFEVNGNQKNICNFKVKGKRKTVFMTSGKDVQQVKF